MMEDQSIDQEAHTEQEDHTMIGYYVGYKFFINH